MDSQTEKTELSRPAQPCPCAGRLEAPPSPGRLPGARLGKRDLSGPEPAARSSTAVPAEEGPAAAAGLRADTALARAARGPAARWDSPLGKRSRPPSVGRGGASLGRGLGEKDWLGCAGRSSSGSKCQSACPQPATGFSPASCQEQSGGGVQLCTAGLVVPWERQSKSG